MNDRRPTDLELVEALGTHLPVRAPLDVSTRIAASLADVDRQRPLPWVFGALTDADPVARRHAVLIAATLLLAAAVAGAAAVGAMRLLDQKNPLRADEQRTDEALRSAQPSDPPSGPPSRPPNLAAAPGPIAFISHGDLYVAQDGSGPVAVARGDGSSFTQPRWSVDRRWIALQTPEPAILLFETSTGNMRRLGAGEFAAWSPVGPELALVTGSGSVVIFDVERGTTRTVIEGVSGVIGWSPNGSWLLASVPDRQTGGLTLRRVDTSTGATTDVAIVGPGMEVSGGWAPDSKRIAYTEDFIRGYPDRVKVVDTDTREVTEIVEPSDQVGDSSWSPDGEWVAYVTRNAGLVISHPDGTGRRVLVVGRADPGDLVGWLPDSSGIAYHGIGPDDQPEPPGFRVVMLTDGSDRLLDVPDAAADLSWGGPAGGGGPVPPIAAPPAASALPALPVTSPPDGTPLEPTSSWGSISFLVPHGESECALALLRFPDEESIIPRTGTGGPSDPRAPGEPQSTAGPQPVEMCDPLFSPDGTAVGQIGRTSFEIPWRDGAPSSTRIEMFADAWSPRGTWIFGQACPTQGGDACSSGPIIVRPDGSGRRALPGRPTWSGDERVMLVSADDGSVLVGNGDGTDLRPIGTFPGPIALSPDGSRFAFVRDGDVWLARIDGTDVRNLSGFELGGAVAARWSPDGRLLTVLQGQTLWILSPDGSVRQRVGADLGPGDGQWEWTPAWSPDGTWLAVEHDDRVMLVNVVDWRVIRIENARAPSWSPDGRHLAVVARHPAEVWMVDVTDPDGSGRVTARMDVILPAPGRTAVGWVR